MKILVCNSGSSSLKYSLFEAETYAVPRKWTNDWGLHRYGFHGLSHAYCSQRAAEMLDARDLRLIIAHLGNGASVSAVRNGICVDTSMGFTPLEGVVMGTRSGSIDPGLLLYLVQTIGAMAATLGGVDGLVFTAGVGENSARVRELACANLGHLGLELDQEANEGCRPDADVALPHSRGRILVIATNEDLTIMRQTRQLLESSTNQAPGIQLAQALQ